MQPQPHLLAPPHSLTYCPIIFSSLNVSPFAFLLLLTCVHLPRVGALMHLQGSGPDGNVDLPCLKVQNFKIVTVEH